MKDKELIMDKWGYILWGLIAVFVTSCILWVKP
jgi:hypothetical protein